MNFLKKVIKDGEHPVCRTHLHAICLITGFVWLVALAGIAWFADYNLWYYFGAYIPQYEIDTSYFRFGIYPGLIGWLGTLGGLSIFFMEFVQYISTSIVVTNRRVLHKRGLIRVRVDASDLIDILGVHIDQGWFGQFLGYGRLNLDCRFIENVSIPFVKNPYGIMQALQKSRNGNGHHAAHPVVEPAKAPQPVSQTLIQISGSGPVYLVDKVPNDPVTPLRMLPQTIGNNMLNAFRRKA